MRFPRDVEHGFRMKKSERLMRYGVADTTADGEAVDAPPSASRPRQPLRKVLVLGRARWVACSLPSCAGRADVTMHTSWREH